MEQRVTDELKTKITNLDLDRESDRDIYQEMYEKTGARKYVDELRGVLAAHEDLSRYSRPQLEEKYRGMIASYVQVRIEATEWMTLLDALDLKVSRVMAILEEEAAKYPLKSGELAQLLDVSGLFLIHKFYVVPDDPREPAKVPKPKRDRGSCVLLSECRDSYPLGPFATNGPF